MLNYHYLRVPSPGKVNRNDVCFNNNCELVTFDDATPTDDTFHADFPLLKPPPPYSVVVTPATPRTPTSEIR